MIGRKNLHVTAERANFPLGALNVRAGSAANVALFDVPVRAGVSVTAVWMRVVNCDGESADYAAVQTGTLWVVDVPAAHFATPGEVPNGVEVWASGTGADGDPHTWSIGVGDLCVLDGDSGEPVPSVAWTAIKLRETVPDNPAYGDAMISSGAFYVWDGTTWVGGGGGGGITDDTVTRTSSNAVKSSGIWSAIWGALTALPTGFTALYDWVVDQLTGKADKSEMSVTPGTGYDSDKTTIQLRSGVSATVLRTHQSISGKLDKSGGRVTGDVLMYRGSAVVFGDTNGPAVYSNDGTTLKADTRGTTGAVALLSDIPAVPAAYTSSPEKDGAASAGTPGTYACGNHRHPTDTSRQAALSQTQLSNIAAVPNKLDTTGGTRTVTAEDSGGTETYAFVGTGEVGNANAVARIKELPYVNEGEAGEMLVGVYAISSRGVQRHTATSGETSATFGFADTPGMGEIADAILDIDNSGNTSTLGMEFSGLGTTFTLVAPDGDDLAEMTSVDGGKQARFYFTETALVSNGLPVISIQRITLGAVATAITRGS